MKNRNKFHTVRGYQLLVQDRNTLTSAMEDYLEMIYRHSLGEGYIRVNTLSEKLSVKPSSATKMVQKLAGLGLLHYEKYGIILLTEKGREIGKFLLNRHNVIETFLKTIGVEDNILAETELIEHNISINTLKRIDTLNSFFKENPDVTERFARFKAENSRDLSRQ